MLLCCSFLVFASLHCITACVVCNTVCLANLLCVTACEPAAAFPMSVPVCEKSDVGGTSTPLITHRADMS